ncbi:MAG: uroporphyrinogen-III C-methyltransferase [Dehalococcoidia bacterium]
MTAAHAAPATLGHVWLVGAGPGDPGLITVAGLEALRRAEVVVHDRLSSPDLLREPPADALVLDAGKSPRNQRMTQGEINAALIEHGRAGRRVVRLKGGDPYVFGRGGEEAMALAEAGVPCTVVPGVTSAIGGLAAGGVPVTHRGIATSFTVVTGHEDPTKPEAQVRWDALAHASETLVILMGVERLEGIARAIVEAGRDPETPAALVQEATTPRQRTVTGTLATIAEVARAEGITNPALFVVGGVAGLQPTLDPARLAPLAGKRVLVTRSRSQASALVTALRLEGAHPVELPAIEIEQRVDDDALRDAISLLDASGYRWVVFTSANAVEVFLDALMAQRDLRAFGDTRVCAIGPATERALVARGLRPDLVPGEAIGEDVARALLDVGGMEGARVLLPRAEQARDALPDTLRAAGAEVDDLPLYLAAPPAQPPEDALALVREGHIEVVTFTSSSTVRNLARLLGSSLSALAGATIACIGPATADTAREVGLPVHVTAETHTIEGLVAALRSHLYRVPATQEVI